jgi:hypothetical protein
MQFLNKPHRFLPVTDLLEQMAPVSSLVLGPLEITPPATVFKTEEGGASGEIHASGSMRAASRPAPRFSAQSSFGVATTRIARAHFQNPVSESSALHSATTPRAAIRQSDSVRSRPDSLAALAPPAESPIATRPSAPRPAPRPAAAQPQPRAAVPNFNPVSGAPPSRVSAPPGATVAPAAIPARAGVNGPSALTPGQPGPGSSAPQPVVAPSAGATAAPFITYSDADGATGDSRTKPKVTDMTRGSVWLKVGDNNGNQISTVSWSVSASNVYANQILNERTGFTNLSFSAPKNVAPNPLLLCWGDTPGNYTITANVTYVGSKVSPASASLQVSVLQPVGNIASVTTGTPTLTSGRTEILAAASRSATPPYNKGINYTATVNPTLFVSNKLSGQFGLIQTYTGTSSYQYTGTFGTVYTYDSSVSNPPGGPKTEPRPVVDDSYGSVTFAGTFYRDAFVAVNSASTPATASLTEDDTPGISGPNTFKSLSWLGNFTVTLMFEPTGGIWVPLGHFSWYLNMSGSVGSAGKWGITYTPTKFTGYTASAQYPTWKASNYYLWSTYGQFVQVSP